MNAWHDQVQYAMPKMTRTQLMHLDDEGRAGIANTDLPNDGFVAEDPPVWLLRYPGFSRITTAPAAAREAREEGARVVAYLPLEDVTEAAHPEMPPIERLRACEDVLRSLASYLSAGGYNAPYVDAQEFYGKILWGIQQIEHGDMV